MENVQSELPGRDLFWFESVGSTMIEAARLAASGANAVVVADEQTAGQGRQGRGWYSPRGAGLYVSIVLRLPLAPAIAPVLTLALGLATAEAIALDCDLRWPNDVLIKGKKCAGILVQCEAGAFIAGIGINVNHESFPPGIEAISLYQATGVRRPRGPLLIDLVRAVDRFSGMLVEQGPRPILEMFERVSSYARGKRVRAESAIEGTTDGLSPSGFLYVRGEGGQRHMVVSGGVRPLTPST